MISIKARTAHTNVSSRVCSINQPLIQASIHPSIHFPLPSVHPGFHRFIFLYPVFDSSANLSLSIFSYVQYTLLYIFHQLLIPSCQYFQMLCMPCFIIFTCVYPPAIYISPSLSIFSNLCMYRLFFDFPVGGRGKVPSSATLESLSELPRPPCTPSLNSSGYGSQVCSLCREEDRGSCNFYWGA